MTYATGNPISASDFNTFARSTSIAAASAIDGQYAAGFLWGVGYGDRGYGQTSPSLEAAVANLAIGQEWQNLRTVINNLAAWQGTSLTMLPPSTSFTAGNPIIPHPANTATSFADALTLVYNNRLNYQPGNTSLTTASSSTRLLTPWGSGLTGIACEFTINFASENAARFFFNTGGDLRVAMTGTPTSSPQNLAWANLLNGLSIAFKANTTTKLTSGTTVAGTANAIGYYQLTTAFQPIFDASNAGGGLYSANDFIIYAKAVSIAGTSGAKGNSIVLRVELTDQHTNAFSDSVLPGTTATLSYLKATTGLTVAAPSASTSINF